MKLDVILNCCENVLSFENDFRMNGGTRAVKGVGTFPWSFLTQVLNKKEGVVGNQGSHPPSTSNIVKRFKGVK